MSEPEDDKQTPPILPGPSPWRSREGEVVHPDAPAGSGGLGRFRAAGSLGTDGNATDDVRHPRAPSLRHDALSDDEKAEALDGGVKVIEPLRNAPPATAPEEFDLPAHKTSKRIEIKVKVKVVADGKKPNPKGDAGARTFLDPRSIQTTIPPYGLPAGAPDTPPDTQKITGVVGNVVVTGTVTIQIQYGDEAKPKDGAAWGRGTTTSDVQNKDTTVGFHESCHLADYKTYLRNNPIPVSDKIFSAKTIAEYDAAAADIGPAVNKHFQDCETDSRTKTDEVGTKMTDYLSTHPNASGH